ncbi:MAG TPA: hypothetical protein VF642_12520 [Propionibacteriaceae bacterium]
MAIDPAPEIEFPFTMNRTVGAAGHPQAHNKLEFKVNELAEGVAGMAPAIIAGRNARVAFLDDQPGVPLNGTTECSAAIQSAINAAEAAGLTLVAGRRTYVTNNTLTFKKSMDFYEATIAYAGVGTAVVIGDTTNGISRQNIRVGRIVNTSKVVGSFTEVAGSIGVQIVDTNKSLLFVKSVTKFEAGIEMLGHARGTAYDQVFIGELVSNKINMRFATGTSAGYTNGNQIYGGSWNHDQTECGGANVADTRHVLMTSSTPGPVADTNTFYTCSFEGNVAEYFLESYGKMNAFRDCRWEATSPKIWWRADSYGNAVRDGYKPELLTITNEGDYTNVVTWPASGDIAEIVIHPHEMYAAVGSPTLGTILRHPVVNTVNGGTEVLAFTARLPLNWHTYDVDIHIAHDVTGGTGTISWTWRPSFNGTGDTLAQPTGSTSSAITAVSAQKVKKVMPVVTAQTASPGKQLTANIFAGGGTFSGSMGVLAVVLRRRS